MEEEQIIEVNLTKKHLRQKASEGYALTSDGRGNLTWKIGFFDRTIIKNPPELTKSVKWKQ